MASVIRQDDIDFFMEMLRKYEPYPMDLYMDLGFDDRRCPDKKRLAASICLRALLDMGFTEDEVNPWKNRN